MNLFLKDIAEDLQHARNLIDMTQSTTDQNNIYSLINASALIIDNCILDINHIIESNTQDTTQPCKTPIYKLFTQNHTN